MKIAVYSGSFNPLHIGHLAIMDYLGREGAYDWTYLIVSPQNPLKDASNQFTGQDRYMAAIQAVKRHPGLKVWVDDIELRLPPPQYSIHTLDVLRKREPGNDFTLVIGADNLDSIRRWRDYRRILCEYGVAVYPRSGFDLESISASLFEECPDYKIRILDAPIVDISSTRIREGISGGEDMSDYLM